MKPQKTPQSKQSHQPQLATKSLINKSFKAIGSIGVGIATMGVINSEAQATGSAFVIPIDSTPNNSAPATNAPKINKPVKVKPTVKLSQPKVSVPSSTQRKVTSNRQAGKNRYLDTNTYTTRQNNTPPKTPAVIVKDRLTGCQTVVSNGGINNGNCGSRQVAHKTQQLPAINRRQSSQNVAISKGNYKSASVINSVARNINQNINRNSYSYRNSYASKRRVPPEYSHASRREQIQTNSNTALLFPLSLPSRISSTFGWRVHPITGSRRMHYGTDLAAPMGTPVLAAYDGEVAIADKVGGYGLTVILRHEEGYKESRYAHLSEIFVNQGEWVERGSVIGLVGSTGFSTGPHLHFEWRHLTANGWIAVDAGLHLQSALDNLIKSIEIAQANSNSNQNSSL